VFRRLKEDIETVFARDPAAKSALEVLLFYPGLHAVWLHRIAHWLYERRLYTLARCVSHINRFLTGIEIHPGARIGRRFFIDHGMGVVIGETAEIGDDVLLYQGVVLGGTSLEKRKRHPTLENGVVVGAGAILLGNINIGEGARVGAGSVVIRPVPAGTTVVGVPGRLVKDGTTDGRRLEHGRLPDPVADMLRTMIRDHDLIEMRIHALEEKAGIIVPSEAHVVHRGFQDYFYYGEGI